MKEKFIKLYERALSNSKDVVFVAGSVGCYSRYIVEENEFIFELCYYKWNNGEEYTEIAIRDKDEVCFIHHGKPIYHLLGSEFILIENYHKLLSLIKEKLHIPSYEDITIKNVTKLQKLLSTIE